MSYDPLFHSQATSSAGDNVVLVEDFTKARINRGFPETNLPNPAAGHCADYITHPAVSDQPSDMLVTQERDYFNVLGHPRKGNLFQKLMEEGGVHPLVALQYIEGLKDYGQRMGVDKHLALIAERLGLQSPYETGEEPKVSATSEHDSIPYSSL